MNAAERGRILGWMREAVEPEEDLAVWEWAEKNIVLPSSESEAAGRFDTSLTPFIREPLEGFRDPHCKRLVLMCGTQVVKTMTLMVGAAWFVDHRQERMIWMMDAEHNARSFSETRWQPLVENSPALADLIPSNRDLYKNLEQRLGGALLNFVGSNSPGNLASRPAGCVIADETDKMPARTEKEGDAITQLRQRTKSRTMAFEVMASSPTTEDGVIWREFSQGTMKEFLVSCPECMKDFCFETGNGNVPTGRLVWPAEAKGEDGTWDLERVKREAAYECPHCGGRITTGQKPELIAEGRWVAQNENPVPGVESYHLASICSPWVSCSFGELAVQFLEFKRQFDLKSWDNYFRGWPTFTEADRIEGQALLARREQWEGIPERVELCTLGIDTQDDRLEVSVFGWADGMECWTLEHEILWGDTQKMEVWNDLERYLLDQLERPGPRFTAGGIDVGGHSTDAVYQFCRRMRGRFPLYAMKGANREGMPIIGRPGKVNKYGVRLYMVGTDTAKERVHGMFRVDAAGSPGYCHFPADLDEEHFLQLAAEEMRPRYRRGHLVREWHKIRSRNEALDCFVYGLAALHIRGMRFLGKVAPAQQTALELPEGVKEVPLKRNPQAPSMKPRTLRPRRPGGGGFVSGF